MYKIPLNDYKCGAADSKCIFRVHFRQSVDWQEDKIIEKFTRLTC